MRIETKRLILRELKEDDFSALFEILSDKETMQHCQNTFDENQVKALIKTNIDNYKSYKFGLFAVELKETGIVIGVCGLTLQTIDGKELLELDYYLNKKYFHKGFASEAARTIVDWLFSNTKYDAIYSCMKYSNVSAYFTAISSGMEKLNEYVDENNTFFFVYEITRLEWQAEKNEN